MRKSAGRKMNGNFTAVPKRESDRHLIFSGRDRQVPERPSRWNQQDLVPVRMGRKQELEGRVTIVRIQSEFHGFLLQASIL